MPPRDRIIETITSLFINTDKREWNGIVNLFAGEIIVDYTSMTGGKPLKLTPQKLIDTWKELLPGFDFTHHQITNFIVDIDEVEANVFCYGNAAHFLENEGGNVWNVIGAYEFHMARILGQWKIDMIKFIKKYQDGNLNLADLARQRAKS